MRHFTPKETYAFMQAHPRAVMLDVRTEIEHTYIGHPPGAVHIPWSEVPNWERNPHFVADVERAVPDKSTPLLMLCRSGKRTLPSGKMLEEAGYTDVINILYGYEGDLDDQMHRNTVNGWRFDGLPWQQL